jgi:hypothetical protein
VIRLFKGLFAGETPLIMKPLLRRDMLTKSTIESKLDEEIISELAKLERLKDHPEKYDAVVDRIAKLHALKTGENKLNTEEFKLQLDSRIQLPNLDTVLFVSANIFGILWLTRYEKEHVLSSKALGFVMKPR